MIYAVCIVCVLASSTLPTPTARSRHPYWQMVSEVVAQIESQPPRPTSISGTLQTPGQEYPFEAFRHLRAVDLLRAAREGVEVARQEAALGKSAAEVDAQVLHNITLAFEYLPLLMREEKDLEQLMEIVKGRNEDPALRMFVLERLMPDVASPGLMSLSLPYFIDDNEDFFAKGLIGVASHPGERPALQATAIAVYYQWLLRGYRRIFERDPVVEMLRETGLEIRYEAARNKEELVLAEETTDMLREQGKRMQSFAKEIAGHIAEGSIRDARVKTQTRHVLEDIRDSILGIDEDKLNGWLKGKVVEEEIDFPALPTQPQMLSPQGHPMPTGIPPF